MLESVGEVRVGFEEVDVHAGLLVDGDHLVVLGERLLSAEHEVRRQRGPRDRAGRQPAVVVGGAEQDVEQAAILGVDAPGSVGRHEAASY
jgi:hypothetical protein